MKAKIFFNFLNLHMTLFMLIEMHRMCHVRVVNQYVVSIYIINRTERRDIHSLNKLCSFDLFCLVSDMSVVSC